VTRLERALPCIAADLDELAVGWALVGGLALNAYGADPPSSDIDIVIRTADDDATRVLAGALRARGHLVHRVAHERLGEVVVVHPSISDAPPLGVLVDMLPRACGFEAEIVTAAQRMDVLGVKVPVARLGHLIAFKVKAIHDVMRARDRRHLAALLALATDADRDVASKALRLSVERGVLKVDDPFAIFDRYPLGRNLRRA
jgi:hypothetical protein